jgi:tripartite-type tricarboxylate transporter receptor subunit TctC
MQRRKIQFFALTIRYLLVLCPGLRGVLPALLAALLVGALVGAPCMAQSWPARTITIIVPFTPGTGVDAIARGMAQRLSERLGVSLVVDNRAGASGNIGHELVARSAPDGYTLLVTAATFVNNAAVNRNLRYDPLRQFAPIVMLASGAQTLVVGPGSTARNVKELVSHARSQPGKLFYGTPGNGTPHHLAMELFKLESGVELVHVPYKGFGGAVSDLIGGRLEAMVMPSSAAVPYVQNNQLRVLAVVATERSAVFPNAPTLAEEGYPKVVASNWYALLAPAGTPVEILGRLNSHANAILADATMRESLTKQGFATAGGTPERLASLMKSDLERWTRVAAAANIKAD